ncbi:MAG: integrase domain-containing protein [Candidatus Competibacteraceae bacterium]|nr:integrase domain-containing protein [Candidatus Competibacteraceae bacterium]
MLERAAAGYSQKQLDSDRRALHLLTGADLAKVHAIVRETRQSRAYTAGQVALITRHQTPAHALATQLAYRAGLRGQELLTLRRPDEGTPPSRHRQWHPDRFQGRDGLRYWVTGKGGLVREVLLPTALATQLEARRLAQPRPVKDRGVYGIMQRYALPGGNAWESAFSAASKRALGWSTGAHGLRHAYAQERYTELMRAFPLPDATARAIVAGELGHFRGEITETYLR